MQIRRSVVAAAAATFAAASLAASVGAVPKPWKNCTQVNKRYAHGVGKVGAYDRTSGDPVTNFRRSNKLYRLALKYNRGLDRDHDGIACEKT